MYAKKKYFGGNILYYCANCNTKISSKYDREFTDIKFFGPPIIECNKCGKINKTNLLPYSKLSFLKKTLFWIETLLIPTIIWFFAGPIFLIGIIWYMFLDSNPTLNIFFIALITVPVGSWFIIKKNLKMISAVENEYIFFKKINK